MRSTTETPPSVNGKNFASRFALWYAMKNLLLVAVAVFLLCLKPAYANNPKNGLEPIAYLFLGLVCVGVLSVIVSIVAYRTDKTIWKIVAAIFSSALALGGCGLSSFDELVTVGYLMVAMAGINIFLIFNANIKNIALRPRR